ncbi:MAG: DNA polymerase [Candidatus Lokiarchaeota archaeon]
MSLNLCSKFDDNNFHIFRKGSKSINLQNNFIFVDTESTEKTIDTEKIDGIEYRKKRLIFKLGCAIFWKRNIELEPLEKTYFNIDEFWNDVERLFSNENKEWILFAHNTQFDLKMLDGFNQLINRGWKLENHYVRNSVFILMFKKDDFVLHIWDTMNYVKQSLESLGNSIGYKKLEVDFEKSSESELITYCKRDCEIIYQFIKQLLEFLEQNDLSKLKSTAGSLSFNIFRHKFYDEASNPIVINGWKRAIHLERESYRGGITDVFRIGTYDKLYKMDINSMYPSIMKNQYVPTKLVAYRNLNSGKDKLFDLYKYSKENGYGVIMSCKIKIPKRYAYILSDFGLNKSTFAYGITDITLCSPELDFLERYGGKILQIYEINIYEMKNIFQDFVDFFYSLRLLYKQDNDTAKEKFTKLILNSQYGKWGQREVITEQLTEKSKILLENQFIISTMIDDKINQIRNNSVVYLGSINGIEIYIIDKFLYFSCQTANNSKESFVAISSFITSYARIKLINYLLIANRENVFYTDTDSLFVNQEGYENLKKNNCIDDNKIGKLKIEDFGSGTFYSPKFYDFNDVRKCKGIRKNSVIIEETKDYAKYKTEFWSKFKTDLKEGTLNNQIINERIKIMNKTYDKGKIDDLGYVMPYSITEIKCINNN